MAEKLSAHHIAILVRDLDRAERFYSGVLGLPFIRRWTDPSGMPRSVWLELGSGAFLALELSTDAAGADSTTGSNAQIGWHCVALAIGRGEREAWRNRLAAAGFPVERESPFTLYARDPDGALVALSHYPERSG